MTRIQARCLTSGLKLTLRSTTISAVTLWRIGLSKFCLKQHPRTASFYWPSYTIFYHVSFSRWGSLESRARTYDLSRCVLFSLFWQSVLLATMASRQAARKVALWVPSQRLYAHSSMDLELPGIKHGLKARNCLVSYTSRRNLVHLRKPPFNTREARYRVAIILFR